MVTTSPSTTASTSPKVVPALSRVIHPLPLPAPEHALPSLRSFLTEVPDPRDPRGVRHPLSAILTLVCLAMASGIQGYLPTAEWAAALELADLRRMGFSRDKAPVASTFFTVLQAVSWEALEQQLRQWATTVAAALPRSGPTSRKAIKRHKKGRRYPQTSQAPVPDPDGIAIDGKTLRGSWKRGAEIAHMLSVVTHGLGLTLAQARVGRKCGELTALRALLPELLLDGLVLTFDAAFTQRDVAQTVLDQGGDYLMQVKENQPTLLRQIETLLSPEHWEPGVRQSAYSYDTGHGRIEERQLVAHAVPPGSLDWPGAAQVLVVISRRVPCIGDVPQLPAGSEGAEATLRYAITSLTPAKAPPERLQRLVRGHWTVENCCFWVRDVVQGEDDSPVKQANIVAVLASLRGAILTLLRARSSQRPAKQIRQLNASRNKALEALGCP